MPVLVEVDCYTLVGESSISSKNKDYRFILEIEVLPNVWQKIRTINSKKSSVIFKSIEKVGNYRLTEILSSNSNSHFKNVIYSKSYFYDPLNSCPDDISSGVRPNSGILINKVSLFPNPVKSHFTVYSNEQEIEEIEIYSIEGRIVNRILVKKSMFRIETNTYSSGLYLVKVKLDSGLIETKKIFIKE